MTRPEPRFQAHLQDKLGHTHAQWRGQFGLIIGITMEKDIEKERKREWERDPHRSDIERDILRVTYRDQAVVNHSLEKSNDFVVLIQYHCVPEDQMRSKYT